MFLEKSGAKFSFMIFGPQIYSFEANDMSCQTKGLNVCIHYWTIRPLKVVFLEWQLDVSNLNSQLLHHITQVLPGTL